MTPAEIRELVPHAVFCSQCPSIIGVRDGGICDDCAAENIRAHGPMHRCACGELISVSADNCEACL